MRRTDKREVHWRAYSDLTVTAKTLRAEGWKQDAAVAFRVARLVRRQGVLLRELDDADRTGEPGAKEAAWSKYHKTANEDDLDLEAFKQGRLDP